MVTKVSSTKNLTLVGIGLVVVLVLLAFICPEGSVNLRKDPPVGTSIYKESESDFNLGVTFRLPQGPLKFKLSMTIGEFLLSWEGLRCPHFMCQVL